MLVKFFSYCTIALRPTICKQRIRMQQRGWIMFFGSTVTLFMLERGEQY